MHLEGKSERKAARRGQAAQGDRGGRILIVDDEVNIIRALKRLLRREGYEIKTAESGEEGLEILKKEQVDLIISDQRMPGMKGVEFLEHAQQICPQSVRMILSGYTDLQSVTEAVNRGHVFKFILKPWDDNELKDVIRQALAMARLRSENQALNQELRARNEQLQWLNAHLEEKVAARTRELELRNTALENFQYILHEMPVGVLGVGDDGRIAFANTWAQRHLGRPGMLLLDQPVGLVCGPEVGEAFEVLRRDKEEFALYVEGQGTDLPMRVQGAPVRHAQGPCGYVLVFIDECSPGRKNE